MGRAIGHFLLVVMAVLAFTPGVLAIERGGDIWNRTCVNNVETALFCDGLCSNPGAVIVNHTRICSTTCNNQTNSCDEPYNVPTEFFIFAITAFLAIAAIFIVIANKFKDDWGIINLLFYIAAMIFVVAAIGTMGSYFIMGQNAVYMIVNTTYLAVGFIFFIFVAYIIMRFIVNFAVKWMESLNTRGKGRKR